jgi:hypothetical protein
MSGRGRPGCASGAERVAEEGGTVRRAALGLLLLTSLLLSGCLEVEQHPPWVDGAYNGKPDDLPQQARFHGSRLSWNAAITDRNHQQNEYLRTQ